MHLKYFLSLCSVIQVSLGGIEIPRDLCVWRAGGVGDFANRCDGDMVAVGSCGSGRYKDCPGPSFTQLECCAVPGFYYGSCKVWSGTWGELLECPSVSDEAHMVEAACGSDTNESCSGHAHEVECCVGHMDGRIIGSTGQCSWIFTGAFGGQLECGRNDEAIMGRCGTGGGSGGNGDCPDGNVR